ncbi:hypothetical protein ACJIZ3_009430 [Penstemon smallii]|uniref:Transmembrane protein n=1 Tax=Penstemon smallii TaxID=265156 RepID=A0ABD3TCH9_9LAMI
MYRSASTNRVADDHFSYHSSSSLSPSSNSKASPALRALSLEASELPVNYEPLSEAAKKEKSRAKFAETAVHLIPLVLLLCAFILWFLSDPNIDVRGNAIAANIEGLTIEGDLESDGTGHAHLPVDLGDLDPSKLAGDTKNLFSENKSP